MYVAHASGRDAFLANRPAGTAIRVVRMGTSVLKRRPNLGVTSFPAVQLTYSFYNAMTDTEWIFNETLVAENPRGGFVSFAGTLWDDRTVCTTFH